MKYSILLCFLAFICSNNDQNKKIDKAYSNYHIDALRFCKENGYNDKYYFLVDLSFHSGKNRFFVYDFTSNKIVNKNIVTHGSCDVLESNDEKWEKAKFSNTLDSHCSMEGKFKVGKRDYSSWGINVKYWLHGLESTNKNAVDRVVVLHSWNAVADKEIYPKVSPLSWGCPAVSNNFMKILDAKLKVATKPVLLWIIN